MIDYRNWMNRKNDAKMIKLRELFNQIARKQGVRQYIAIENFKNWSHECELNKRSKDAQRKIMKDSIFRLIAINGSKLYHAYQKLKQNSIEVGKSSMRDQFIRDRLQ